MKQKWITAAIAASTIGLIGTGNLLAEKNGENKGPGKGRPSREQMHKKMLEKFDADGDGKLNETERAKAKAAMQKRGAEKFAKADKNGDGKLSKDEVPAEVWARMSKADKNGDGAVSKEEMKAAHAGKHGKGGAKKTGKGKKPKKPADS